MTRPAIKAGDKLRWIANGREKTGTVEDWEPPQLLKGWLRVIEKDGAIALIGPERKVEVVGTTE